VVLLSVGRDVAETGGLGADSLGWQHVMSKGLNIFGQGNVGLVVMHQGSGKLVQVVSGASSLSGCRGVQDREGIGWGKGVLCHGLVHGMVRLVSRGRWVWCWWWELPRIE